ncbi:uncharacterized protein LOC136075524 isoform X1 [Hydra vulgaris]|uniref:Uncharacterized protein LOC136075524 isoform X1 n=1 Tax=Hydra vulgaris TaxID=6087 RepID=A0ABM4B7Z0_HYDVU
MNNNKKKPNTYNLLDFAVSKEKRVYDCLLETAIERRNASLALMQWAKVDSNTPLKDTLSSLYEINKMWSVVQIEFANEAKLFQNGLKSILKVEAELEAIQIQIKDHTEMKNFIIGSEDIKKFDKSTENYLKKLEENIVEGKSALKSKKFQAEIHKNTVLRNSLLSVMNSHLKLIHKSESIFSTAMDIIKKLSDFPVHFNDSENIIESQQTGLHTNAEQIKDLMNEIQVVIPNQKQKSKKVPYFNSKEGFPVYFVPNHEKKRYSSTLPAFQTKFLTKNMSDGYIKPIKPRTISAPEIKTYVPIQSDDVVTEMKQKLSKYCQSSDSEFDYYLPLNDDDGYDENQSNHWSSESSDDSSYDSSINEIESKNTTDPLNSIEESKDLVQVFFPADMDESRDKFEPSSDIENSKLPLKRTPSPSPKHSPNLTPKLPLRLTPDTSPKCSQNAPPTLKPKPIKRNSDTKKDIANENSLSILNNNQ